MRLLLFLLAIAVPISGCSKTISPKYQVSSLKEHQTPALEKVGGAREATYGIVDTQGLGWNSSGDWLAFSWGQDKNWGVSVTNGTRTAHIVALSPVRVRGAAGPDRQVAYWKDNGIFYTRDAEKPGGKAVGMIGSGIVHASFAPSGNVIACMAHTDADTGNRLALLETPTLAGRFAESVPLTVRSLRWSPNGDRLALIGRPRDQQPNGEAGNIYTYGLTDQKLSEIVTDHRINRYSWAWSSDGKSIYFAEDGDKSILVKRLWKVGADSGTEELLADLSTLPYRILAAVPAPDGADWLLVTGPNEGTRSLHLLNLPSSSMWTLATGDQWLPAWSPKGDRFAAAVNGNLWLISKSDMTATLIFPTRQGDKT